MREIEKVKEKIESIMEFGDIPSYSVECGRIYIYVCKNDGQFHKGDACGVPGYATYIGRFTVDEATDYFGLYE